MSLVEDSSSDDEDLSSSGDALADPTSHMTGDECTVVAADDADECTAVDVIGMEAGSLLTPRTTAERSLRSPSSDGADLLHNGTSSPVSVGFLHWLGCLNLSYHVS